MSKNIRVATAFAVVVFSFGVSAPGQQKFADSVKPYIKYAAPRIVLAHVRVIDGTGKVGVEDQNVVIENGKITAIQPGSDVAASGNTTVIDGRGESVLPGIVGMHNHMYYIARPDLDAK